MRVIIFGGKSYLDNEQKNVIVNLPLAELEPFPNHPFAVRMDDQMVQLVESVEFLHGEFFCYTKERVDIPKEACYDRGSKDGFVSLYRAF